ncbi:hypothetical protein EYB31_19765 [Paenibacillus thalictri]|uniref:Uncharacterized protein n=2 Tax=Paenibacillus thalictri TaxID=2527873 RepID=A0A4Q9DQ61_9BACL|nr:hypothetical protein EYB31_19765 [Paenibacillus thalictri]
MQSLKFIFARPEWVAGAGDVYPIKLKDYDSFLECNQILYFSKAHFGEHFQSFALLDLLMYAIPDDELAVTMVKLLSLVFRKEVIFQSQENEYYFRIDEKGRVDHSNYEQVRMVIMQQNLMFEQKIFKNKLAQEWAGKVLEAKSKGGVKITLEDMITTVSALTGKTYEQLAEQSIYQLSADFKRIVKDKDYHTNIAQICAGASGVTIRHFAEQIDMFENPYDSLFVDKNKLTNLNKALQ